MQKTLLALITACTLASTAVHAQDAAAANEARGKVLADTCMGCHGIESYRNAYPSFRVPKLGGQHADYVVLALQAYRNGTRGHDTMHAQAASLTDQDMRDIAAFFASEGAAETGAAVVTPGKDKTVTCVACHGETGISPTPTWPILAGQYRDYLIHTLHQYKNGERKDPVMGGQAAPLTDEDIDALATYFAAQSGLFTVHDEN